MAQVTGGAASKLAKISVVRKKIARVLTVYHQAQKQRVRDPALVFVSSALSKRACKQIKSKSSPRHHAALHEQDASFLTHVDCSI